MRYSKRYRLYTFLSMLPSVLLVPIVMMAIFTTSEEDSEEIIFNNILGIDSYAKLGIAIGVVCAVYVIAVAIFACLWWSMTKYDIDNSGIRLTSGVIFRRNVYLPFEKIHAITIDRPLFMRFFRLSKLAIDSGNTAQQNNEIVIYDTEDNVKLLEKQLHARLTGVAMDNMVAPADMPTEDNRYDYKVDFKLALTYVFNNVWIYIAMLVALGAGIAIAVATDVMLLYFMPLILPLGACLLFGIVSIAVLLLRYYNYCIILKDDEIVVSFGLFDIKRVVINKNRIKSIYLSRDIVQLKTGYCSVHFELVGLASTEDQSEIAVSSIIPFVQLDKAERFLALATDSKIPTATYRASSKSRPFFLLLPALIILAIALPFYVGCAISPILGLALDMAITSGVVAIALVCTIVLGMVAYSHQGIAYDQDNLYLYKGVLVEKQYVIPWKNVVSIKSSTTPVRRRFGVTSIVVSTYTNKLETAKTVSMLDETTYNDILTAFLEKK